MKKVMHFTKNIYKEKYLRRFTTSCTFHLPRKPPKPKVSNQVYFTSLLGLNPAKLKYEN